jgi:HD-GYP domain-containing protein (c-di-GMP phosphodiesterase class II)
MAVKSKSSSALETLASPQQPVTVAVSDGARKSREAQKRTDANELLLRLKNLTEIGIALSSERNLSRLLERILTEARRLTNADAGTIYMVRDDQMLHFEVMHNDTLGQYRGGSGNLQIPDSMKPVPLDDHSVSGYAALAGKTIHFPDVYEAQGFDFTGFRRFDEQHGYRSQSMLVVPMLNHEGEPVGVLQLINAETPDGLRVIPFPQENVALVESLASQAAVALSNAQLIENLEQLFESLIHVMAKAVDEKSPMTAGHINRVTALSLALGKQVNATHEGEYASAKFTDDELNELRIAGWLHDIGKLTTPEWVMNKGNKLETLFDRAELLKERFGAIAALRRAEGLEEKLQAVQEGASPDEIAEMDQRTADDLALIEEELQFVLACNIPGEFLEDAKIERLKALAGKTYRDSHGTVRPYLTEDELENLSIRKGSINWKELQIMRDHVSVTMEMLELVPFVKKLKNVPLYAGQHHEMLDGKGYPLGLTAEALPLQSRILAVCDVFDALAASDRPYKKAFSLEQVIQILRKDGAAGKLDADLVEIFVQNRIWEMAGFGK